MNRYILSGIVVFATGYHACFGQQLQWSIRPLSTNYMVEEPIMLKMAIYNDSPTSTEVFLGRDSIGALRFGTNDNRLLTNSMLRAGGLIRASSLRLKAGGRYDEIIILDEWLRLPPGEHNVICENCAARLQTQFQLTILPLDREELRVRMTRLIRQAQRRGAINFADPAVQALRSAVRRSPLCKEIIADHPETRADLKAGIENDPTD